MGASASYLGGLIYNYRETIRIIGGILIILMGVHLTGIIRIPGLDVEKRIHMERKPLHFLGTFIIGMAFGAGWSPCIGPLLGSILIIAGSQETVRQGIVLLAIYSAGLALPFIILSVFIHLLLMVIKKASGFLQYVTAAAGILMIIVGLILVTNKLYVLIG
jgi:cytochrome c-type biogenesis protein